MKKKLLCLLLVFLPVVLSYYGCSLIAAIKVDAQFVNIDASDSNLAVRFHLSGYGKKAQVTSITVWEDGRMLMGIKCPADSIDFFSYPGIPAQFKVTYPAGKPMPSLHKNQRLEFRFEGAAKGTYAVGSWIYKPEYTLAENRWKFDRQGNQLIKLDLSYEHWVGRDLIKIVTNDSLPVDKKNFTLTDERGLPVGFKIKYETDPAQILALLPDKDLASGSKVTVTIYKESKVIHKEELKVPLRDNSSIALTGKFSTLR